MLLSLFADSPDTSMPYNNLCILFVINNVNKALVSPDEGMRQNN